MGYSGGPPPRQNQWSSRDRESVPVPQETKSLEHRAAELHAANRRRTELFSQPIMADPVMDIMLTALIALEQGTVLTRTSAAMANRLSIASAETLIDDLVSARLLQKGARRDHISLTPLGSELMREFVRRETLLR